MKNVFPFTVLESNGSVRHEPFTLSASNFRAKVGLRTLAKNASRFTALGCVARDDVIADFHASNSITDRFDYAPSFVSENARK